MRKHKALILLAGILITAQVLAAGRNAALFEAIKVYGDKLLVLNDFIEFSEFDMSEIKFINDANAGIKDVAAAVESFSETATGGTAATGSTPLISTAPVNAEGEVQAVLAKLPQDFYVGFKREIYRNKLPVTLYPKDAPAFAKPLKLYVKIKKIHIKPYVLQRNGDFLQPVELRIYGQLKDKETDQILLKYYDAETAWFTLGKNQAADALAGAAQKLMRDLALYLKPRY